MSRMKNEITGDRFSVDGERDGRVLLKNERTLILFSRDRIPRSWLNGPDLFLRFVGIKATSFAILARLGEFFRKFIFFLFLTKDFGNRRPS